jgi:hypothetical protein
MESIQYYFRSRMRVAAKLTMRWFQAPIIQTRKLTPTFRTSTMISGNDVQAGTDSKMARYLRSLCQLEGVRTEHYSLHRHLDLLKRKSPLGHLWEALLLFFSVFACIIFVCQSYVNSYSAVKVYWVLDLILTQFFTLDLVWNTIIATSWTSHLHNVWTWVDLATIIPTYGHWITPNGTYHVDFSVLPFARILRLARVLRSFKIIRNMSGISRQIVKLFLTLASLLFIGAGFIQILENDANAFIRSKCHFINALTLWEPSCFIDAPASAGGCDCAEYNCHANYSPFDRNHEPSLIACRRYSFFEAFFFCVYSGT